MEFDYISLGVIALILFICFYVLMCVKSVRNGKCITKSKIIYDVMLSIYIAILTEVMLLNRVVRQNHQIKLIPFWSYKEYFQSRTYMLLMQMIYNTFVFIPWPILFALVFPKMKKFLWGIGSAFLFSVFIEVTQLLFKLGMFEFDDMFHNTLGAVMGYLVCILWNKTYKKNRYADEQGGKIEN